MAQVAFEQELVRRGHVSFYRPAHVDEGCDYVIWGSGGWTGVQVKACTRESKGDRKFRRVMKFAQTRSGEVHGRDYYAACGVDVFAVYDGEAFYLIPIAEVRSGVRAVKLNPKWRDAWELLAPAGPQQLPQPSSQMALLADSS